MEGEAALDGGAPFGLELDTAAVAEKMSSLIIGGAFLTTSAARPQINVCLGVECGKVEREVVLRLCRQKNDVHSELPVCFSGLQGGVHCCGPHDSYRKQCPILCCVHFVPRASIRVGVGGLACLSRQKDFRSRLAPGHVGVIASRQNLVPFARYRCQMLA
jgi:hypothetical protein